MVDLNIPPPSKPGRGRTKKYDLSPMPVAGSFFYPFEGDSTKNNRKTLRAALCASATYQNKGGSYTTSKVVENGIEGIRIWRIE